MDTVTICNLALARIGDWRISSLNDARPEAEFCTLFYTSTLREVLRAHPWNFAIKRASLALDWKSLSGSAISNASGLIRVTHTAHGLSTGDRVNIENVTGVTAANASWIITKISNDAFDLQGSVFSGSYTSGTGRWLKVPIFGWNYLYSLPTDFIRLEQLNSYGETEQKTKWEIESGKLLTNEEYADIRYVYEVSDANLFDPLFVECLSLKLASKLAKPLTSSSQMAEEFLTEYARVSAPLAKRIDSSESSPVATPAWVNSDLVTSRFASDIG